MQYLSELGKNIRTCRRSIGLTQRELAEKLHVSTQAISSWEQGNTNPDIENLCRLAEVFSVTTDKLLKRGVSQNETNMIAVDGGKVKSDFVLFSSSGHIGKAFRLPGTSVSVRNLSEVMSILRRGIDLCLEHSPSTSYIFIGNAGSQLDEIQRNLSEVYTGIDIHVASCATNAFHCIDDADAAMILGAGSGIFRMEEDRFLHIGAWGHILGDPGSGYNFGREACRLAYAYRDGLDRDPLIYTLVKEIMDGKKLDADSLIPLQMASLAPVIFHADAQGDARAKAVIEAEMRELARHVIAACPNGGKIVAVGGVIEHCADRLLPVLQEMTGPQFEFVVSKFPAVYGACRSCVRHFQIKVSAEFEEKFAEEFASVNQMYL